MVDGMSSTLEASVTAPSDHTVLFYERDRFLSECVAGYLREGLAEDRDVMVIATAPHLRAFDALLERPAWQGGGDARLTILDAHDTLEELLRDDVLDLGRLRERVEPWLAAANRSGREPRIYGEMVALLWDDSQFERAVQLEALWNRLGRSFSFSLLCGYPMRGFGDHAGGDGFLDVCRQHSAVTTESYSRLRDEREGPGSMVVLDGGSPGGHIHLD
jgi:hypothetical protein